MDMMAIKAVKFFVGVANSINSMVGRSISWLFYPLIIIMVIEIVARYLFRAPKIWVPDTSLWLYSIIFMLGSAYTLLKKKHVTVDLLYARFSPRWRATVDIIAYLVLFFPTIILLFPIAIEGVITAVRTGEVSILTIWRPIIWPFRMLIPVGFFLLMIQGMSEFLQRLVCVINPDIQLLTTKNEENDNMEMRNGETP